MTFYSLALVIASGVIYHVTQHGSGGTRPWPVLAVAYSAAFLLASVLTLASRTDGARWPSSREASFGLLLGLAVFGIEAGYFFLYRSGGQISSAQVVASTSVSVLLVVIGLLAYSQPLTAVRAAGIVLAITGAVLLTITRGSFG